MAWDGFPLSAGTSTNLAFYDGRTLPSHPPYSWIRQIPDAIRERFAIGGTDGSRVPDGSHRWFRGLISGVADQSDGTVKFTFKNPDGTSPTWIDGSSVKRWSTFVDTFNGENLANPPTCAPTVYNVNLYPLDGGSPPATSLADPNTGVVLGITDNGTDTLTVRDDGHLRLNGLAYSDYGPSGTTSKWAGDIMGNPTTGPRQGWGWTQRYPPRPNHVQLDYGTITKAVTITPSGSTFTVTCDGGTTVSVNASDPVSVLQSALATITGHAKVVFKAGSVFTIVFDDAFDDNPVTASGATVGVPADQLFDASMGNLKIGKPWTSSFLTGKEIFFQANYPSTSDPVWRRVSITGAVTDSGGLGLSYSSTDQAGLSISTPPAIGSGYWIAAAGSFWRPEFRLALEQVTTRSGRPWMRSFGGTPFSGDPARPWEPLATWASAFTDTFEATHEPGDDTLQTKAVQVDAISLKVDESDDTVSISVLNADGRYGSNADSCDNSYSLFSPFRYWGLRGLQQWVEELFAAFDWVDPTLTYDGLKAIAALVPATWRKLALSGNTQTSSITSLISPDPTYHTSTGANISSITMPMVTNNSSNTYSSLPCKYAVLKDDDVLMNGTGTVTASTLTIDVGTFVDDPGPPVNTDVGLSVVIDFGWTRKYERRFRYLYPRTVIIPDFTGGGGWPPSAPLSSTDTITVNAPGVYTTTNASSNYFEYDETGVGSESGAAFVTGEAARYHGDARQDHWPGGAISDPTLPFQDLAYQGLPNVTTVSSFPRWEGAKRIGTATGGGTFYLEDTAQLWECFNNTVQQHTGTATAGSDTTHVIGNPLSGNGWWAQPNRFVGMIIEVSFDSGVTWQPRPITAYDSTTNKCTVLPAFGSSPANKPYRITEPGYISTGAILNLWQGRYVTITSVDGTQTARVKINYSDKHRLFFDDGAVTAFTVGAGCNYAIEQLDPGQVLHYKPTGTNPINGWVLPINASADTRGASWHTGADGTYENCPTIVRNFGYFTRGDIPLIWFWNELYHMIDVLRWIKLPYDWSSRSPANFLSSTPEDNDQLCNVTFLAGPDQPSAASMLSRFPSALGTSMTYGSSGTDPDTGGPLEDGFIASVSEEDGTAPSCTWTRVIGGPFTLERVYAYGVISAPTDQLESSMSLYAAADQYTTVTDSGRITQDFTDCGTGLTRGLFKKWIDLSASTDLNRRTPTAFGNAASPPPVTNDVYQPPPTPLGPGILGYQVTRQVAIEKFDVSGGLTYVS